jgi:hypothetical protein
MARTLKSEHRSDSAHTGPRIARKARPSGHTANLVAADLALDDEAPARDRAYSTHRWDYEAWLARSRP